MQTIEIQKGVRVGMEDLINGVSKMETPALERFLDTLSNILDLRKSGTASTRENELLEHIEQVVPAFVKQRYVELHARLQEGTISEPEHRELLQISSFMEEKAVERLHLMAELATLRKVSLKELTEQMRSKRYGNAEA
ncbi:MAG: hypothetical protein R2830_11770 [Saprospiraceae bacterium]